MYGERERARDRYSHSYERGRAARENAVGVQNWGFAFGARGGACACGALDVVVEAFDDVSAHGVFEVGLLVSVEFLLECFL
jgi:hypothetical protein